MEGQVWKGENEAAGLQNNTMGRTVKRKGGGLTGKRVLRGLRWEREGGLGEDRHIVSVTGGFFSSSPEIKRGYSLRRGTRVNTKEENIGHKREIKNGGEGVEANWKSSLNSIKQVKGKEGKKDEKPAFCPRPARAGVNVLGKEKNRHRHLQKRSGNV